MKQSKKIKGENVPSDIIFRIYNMTKNNMSKMFSQSSTWVSSEVANTLLKQGIIQRVISEDTEKYALTFKGIAQCIQVKYGKSLDEQFLEFLELSDQKFSATEQTRLGWKEKLASLSLILMISISDSSAIRLKSDANKAVLSEVFDKSLACLKKFGIVKKKQNLKKVSRGEDPVSAVMSRLNDLPRKTNHYYKLAGFGKESGYFFDIEKDGDIDEKKLFFLLGLILEHYNPRCDYAEMSGELSEISQRYYPRFLARSTNPNVAFSIIKRLKEFMDTEIWHLPPHSQTAQYEPAR